MVMNPYEVLGVQPGADAEEIRRAYRAKAKLYHPDLHPNDPYAARKMSALNEAYDLLQDPGKYEAQKQQQAREESYRRQDPYENPFGAYTYTYSYRPQDHQNGDAHRPDASALRTAAKIFFGILALQWLLRLFMSCALWGA